MIDQSYPSTSSASILSKFLSDADLEVELGGTDMIADRWGDIVKRYPAENVQIFTFTASRQCDDLNAIALNVVDWIGVDNVYTLVFDNSNKFRVSEISSVGALLGILNDVNRINTFRAIRISCDNETSRILLSSNVSTSLYLILTYMGHVGIFAGSGASGKWVAIDDGRISFCCLDKDFRWREYMDDARKIARSDIALPFWATQT
jgi:hypothetical protein